MYNFIFKFCSCGVYSGKLNSPGITVLWFICDRIDCKYSNYYGHHNSMSTSIAQGNQRIFNHISFAFGLSTRVLRLAAGLNHIFLSAAGGGEVRAVAMYIECCSNINVMVFNPSSDTLLNISHCSSLFLLLSLIITVYFIIINPLFFCCHIESVTLWCGRFLCWMPFR